MLSSARQPQSSAHVLEPRTVTIEHECCAADGNLMHECAEAYQLCDRAHTSNLTANFNFIKVVNPSFRPINRYYHISLGRLQITIFQRRKKRVLGFPSFWISILGFIICKYSSFHYEFYQERFVFQ